MYGRSLENRVEYKIKELKDGVIFEPWVELVPQDQGAGDDCDSGGGDRSASWVCLQEHILGPCLDPAMSAILGHLGFILCQNGACSTSQKRPSIKHATRVGQVTKGNFEMEGFPLSSGRQAPKTH